LPVKIYYPASRAEPFPVIIFSHGLGGSREGCAYLGEYWASHGYVSVHLQHPGSDESVWRGKLRPLRALRDSFENPWNGLQRVRDVRFAIDYLVEVNANDPALKGRLDLDRLGVAGHAFGAQTALAVAGQKLPGISREADDLADPRVKAVLSMSAPVPIGSASLADVYAHVDVPCLHMTGTEDDSPVGATRAQDRRLPFEYADGADQYLITFYGADHMTFPGHRRRVPSRSDPLFHRLIQQASTAFFDAYLKDNAATSDWLVNGGLRATLAGAGRLEAKTRHGEPWQTGRP